MKSTEIGNQGENMAVKFLRRHGFDIVDRNWKTTRCEIDIIAKKNDVIYMVEVKYRTSIRFGSGVSYVTTQKLRQMSYAAESWVHINGYEGKYQMAVIGIDPEGITFIEDM